MKRDRDSFFPNFSGGQPNNFMPNNNFFPNPQMSGMPQMQSPQMQGMPQMNQMPGMYNPNMIPEQMNPYGGYPSNPEDYDMRITRIEKMIKKLDSRITKLESKGGAIIDDDDITSSTNMYMI